MGTTGEIKNSINEKELYETIGPIPIELVNKVIKSICKIIIKKEDQIIFGIGFFMGVSDTKRYLITNYHFISQESKKNIEFEIWNKKKINIKLSKRYIKYFPEPKDITTIEIKNYNEINEDIELLNYDLNYKIGYLIYKNVDVFSIKNPSGGKPIFCCGKIVDINNFEFKHNIPTDNGSSGCPIILLNNNLNLVQVIGVHKETEDLNELNSGTFIGEIFNNDLNKNNNCIIAEIDIKDDDINKEIRILNSYEEYQRNTNPDKELDECEKNEEEIKKCEIKINNEVIPFSYFYKFKNKGKYNIKYSFKNYLTKTNYIFTLCEKLTKIDLSNLNTQIITNMHCMFSQCKSLKNIDLSNFNTKKVIDMSWMFWGCKSLTNLDLSSFNTQNVFTFLGMFSYCESFTDINLSSFNTQKAKFMWNMFEGCKSLANINLSSFNTQNVVNIGRMFFGCESLKKIDLSSFNTQNVTDMSYMFFECKSLTYINLYSFYTENVTNMRSMFYGCESLTNIDLSTFNAKNVTDMSYMFFKCKSLINIDLSNFDTKNVLIMDSIFKNCDSLKKLDLTNFNTENVINMDGLFDNCTNLKIENIITDDEGIKQYISN